MIHNLIKVLLSILIILHLYIQGIYIFVSQYIKLPLFLLILGVIYGYLGFRIRSKVSIFLMNNLLILLICIPYTILFFFLLININSFLDDTFTIIYSILLLSILPTGIGLINKNFKLIKYTYVLFSLFLILPFTFILGMRGFPDDQIPFSIISVILSPFIIYPLAILEYFFETNPNKEKS